MKSATEYNVFVQAAKAKWQDIGYDCIKANADDQGIDMNAVLIPADEVAEIIGDYMYDVTGWNELSFEEQDKILKIAFGNHDFYGM